MTREPHMNLQNSQPSLQTIFKYEVNYFNAFSHCVGLQKTYFEMMMSHASYEVPGAS